MPPARRLRSLRRSTAIAIAVLAFTHASLAAPKANDTAIEEAAKARYNEGLKLYKKRRYDEARAAFLQAAALKRNPAATLMLVQSSLNAGRWLEALREIDAYVVELGDVPPKLQETVDAWRAQARAHLGRVRFDVPEGAEVTIDLERVPSVAEPIDVTPGRHTVIITHLREKRTETIDVVAKKTTEVKPVFTPKALVPTSDTRTRPTPGARPVASSASGADQGANDGASILSPPQTTWPVYVGGAVGLGGLAAAAIFGGLAANSHHAVDVTRSTLSRNGQNESVCREGTDPGVYKETCITLKKNQSLARAHQGAFATSLVVGLSGTVIAVGWFLLAPKERGERSPTEPAREGRARVVPWIGLSSGGASFEGHF